MFDSEIMNFMTFTFQMTSKTLDFCWKLPEEAILRVRNRWLSHNQLITTPQPQNCRFWCTPGPSTIILYRKVGCERSLPGRDLAAVIKSAASAASPKTKIQESREASGRRLGMRTAATARLPWIPGFWSSGRLRWQPT